MQTGSTDNNIRQATPTNKYKILHNKIGNAYHNKIRTRIMHYSSKNLQLEMSEQQRFKQILCLRQELIKYSVLSLSQRFTKLQYITTTNLLTRTGNSLLWNKFRENQTGMAKPDVRPPGAASPSAKSISGRRNSFRVMAGRMKNFSENTSTIP